MAKKAPTEPMESNRLTMVTRYLWLPRRRRGRKTPVQWLLRFPTIRQTWFDDDPLPSSALKLRPPARRTARRGSARRRSRCAGMIANSGPINVAQ
jgi:hypothetical protein